MNILAKLDPDSHMPLSDKSTPFLALVDGEFGGQGQPLGGAEIIDVPAGMPKPPVGTKIVRTWSNFSAVNCQVRMASVPPQTDILAPKGRYHHWYMLIPATTLAATAKTGQIKLFLSRTASTKGFVVIGEGNEFGSTNNAFEPVRDFQAMPFSATKPAITPDVWHEIEIWEQRDPATHLGRAMVWYDGVLLADHSHADLGDDDPTVARDATFGCCYTQHANAYPVEVYVTQITVADERIGVAAAPAPGPVAPPVVPPVKPPVAPPATPAGDPHVALMVAALRLMASAHKGITVTDAGLVTFADAQRFQVSKV